MVAAETIQETRTTHPHKVTVWEAVETVGELGGASGQGGKSTVAPHTAVPAAKARSFC